MPRVNKAPASRARRRRVLKKAKGYWGGRRKLYRQAAETVTRALHFSTRDRKRNARNYRSLWIIRVSVACKENGISYSKFIAGLKKAGIGLDRKQLAELCVSEPAVFKELVDIAKKNLPKAA